MCVCVCVCIYKFNKPPPELTSSAVEHNIDIISMKELLYYYSN